MIGLRLKKNQPKSKRNLEHQQFIRSYLVAIRELIIVSFDRSITKIHGEFSTGSNQQILSKTQLHCIKLAMLGCKFLGWTSRRKENAPIKLTLFKCPNNWQPSC